MAWNRNSSSLKMMKTNSPRIISISTTGHHPPSDGPEILQSPRRQLLFQIPKIAATLATSTIMLPHRACNAATSGITPDSAKGQWRQASTQLDDLLLNWSTEKWAAEVGGGDTIRQKLGTQGATSPLYQIEKTFKALRDSEYVDDGIEFQETTEEFMDALYRADSLASSSNNKTGSGKQTPPAVFIEQSREEVIKMQGITKKLNAMVK